MKKINPKTLMVFLIAFIVCFTAYNNVSKDIYSTTYENFNRRYLLDYSEDDTQPLKFGSQANSTVDIHSLSSGALSLSANSYDMLFMYDANDDTSFLKIYSSDYISRDNSGGKVLFSQQLDPNERAVRATFELDQDVNSVYVTIETKDENFIPHSIKMESWGAVCNDRYFYCFLAIALSVIMFIMLNLSYNNVKPVLFKGEEISGKRLFFLFLFIGFGAVIIASIPILRDGLYTGHDITYHTARISGIASGLKSGQFPVRVHGELLNGFAYPNSYFYPELFLYVPAILVCFGVSVVTSYKFYIVFIHILTLILSYIAFKKLFDSRFAALSLSIVYLLNPYRLICAYYRSAIGEFTAMTFLPLLIYGIFALIKGKKRDWIYLVIAATGLLQSHILTTELVALMAIVIAVVFIKDFFNKDKPIVTALFSALYTLALNAWFIGPMLLMIIVLNPAVFTRVQSPANSAKWELNYLFSTMSVTGIGPHAIGWTILFGLAGYVIYRICFKTKDKDKTIIKFFDLLFVLCVVCIIGTTAYFPWKTLLSIPVLGRMLDTIQFPYRLMSIVGVCGVMLLAFCISKWLNNRNSRLIASMVCVVVSVVSAALFFENVYIKENAFEYQTKHYYISHLNNSSSVGQYEYLAGGATIEDMVEQSPVIQSENSTLQIQNFTKSGTTMEFEYTIDLSASDNNYITLPFTYIPKYHISVNGEDVETICSPNRRISFLATSESGQVSVKYKEHPLLFVFTIISLISFIGLFFHKKISDGLEKIICKISKLPQKKTE